MKLQDLVPKTRARGDGDVDRSVKRASNNGSGPVVGGKPLVSLLPREMLDATNRQATRRALLLAVGGIALIMAAVIAASLLAAADARSGLDESSRRLTRLDRQVAKFSDLQHEQQQIALGQAAVRVGGSTSIDWDAQISKIQSVEPAAFSITSVSATGAIPGTPFDQSTDPLAAPTVATLTITATAPDLDSLPVWLRDLRSLPAYASATPVVTQGAGDDASAYTVVITMNLNKKAFRIAAKETTP